MMTKTAKALLIALWGLVMLMWYVDPIEERRMTEVAISSPLAFINR